MDGAGADWGGGDEVRLFAVGTAVEDIAVRGRETGWWRPDGG